MMGRCCKESDVWIKIVPSFPALQCRSMLSTGCSTSALLLHQSHEEQKLREYVLGACHAQ